MHFSNTLVVKGLKSSLAWGTYGSDKNSMTSMVLTSLYVGKTKRTFLQLLAKSTISKTMANVFLCSICM